MPKATKSVSAKAKAVNSFPQPIEGPATDKEKAYPRQSSFKAAYYEKLKDPRWQKVRLKIMERDGFKCVMCDDESSPLNVHHSYYVRGRQPWDYPTFSLRTLCQDCHGYLHENDNTDEAMGLMEWEVEVNWLLNANQRNSMAFWETAASISQAGSRGRTPEEIYKAISIAVEAL